MKGAPLKPQAPQPAKLRGLAPGVEITVPLFAPIKRKKDESEEDFEARQKAVARYAGVSLVIRRLDHKVARRCFAELDRLESAARDLREKGELTEEATEAVLQKHREMLLQEVTTWGGTSAGTALVKVRGIEVELADGPHSIEDQSAPEAVRWLEQLDLLELAGGALLRGQEPTKALGN